MTSDLPGAALKTMARNFMCDVTSSEFAAEMDNRDPLRHFRDEFVFPVSQSRDDGSELYLCGQSLGLKPKRCDHYVRRVLDDWRERGVRTHDEGFLPAKLCETMVQQEMANLVGAKPQEVAILNGLTVNLHLMLSTFYKPTNDRHKIMIEEQAFGSDMYAVKSQIAVRGLDVKNSLITFKPRQGEYILRHEDLLSSISAEGSQVALILLPGLQYLTGQLLDMQALTRAGLQQGCVVGIDLAHSVGNVPLHLHDWGCDFAVWCTYKYLNAGPGSLGAIFVHERHCTDSSDLVHLQGWFGNKISTRMRMDPDFEADEGAARFKLSNTSPVMVAMIKASLEVLQEAGQERLFQKQFLLTGYLELLLERELGSHSLRVLTPRDPKQRGSQLSLLFSRDIQGVADALQKVGVAVDIRKGRTIRVSPVPLYNSFSDVREFVTLLKAALENEQSSETTRFTQFLEL